MFRRQRPQHPAYDSTSDDAVLVTAAQTGDAAAFNVLVQRYERAVYGLAFRMMGTAPEAEDISQEAFLRAWQAIGSYQEGSFRGWLLRIATNRCYDRLRSLSRHPVDSLTSDEDDAEVAVVDMHETADLETFAERLDLSAALQAALDTLPPDQRLAVILFDVMHHTYDEAGAIAGVPGGTIKSRVSRGRERLRQQILTRPDARELIPRGDRSSHEASGNAGFPEQ